MDTNLEAIREVIEDIPVAMLTTVENDGVIRSRPMSPRFGDESSMIWFFTELDHPVALEVQEDQRVNATFVDVANDRYVSVSGTAELVRDRNRVKSLWDDSLQRWFPKGLEDPDLTLIRVEVEHAEYWDPVRACMAEVTLSAA